jgi:chromosome segregation ATPase
LASGDTANYLENLINEIISRRRKRFRRDASLTQDGSVTSEVLKDRQLEGLLRRNATTKNDVQTVGSLLAKIPGILEIHEESYNDIGSKISGIATSLAGAFTLGMSSLGDRVAQVGDQISQGMTSLGDKMEDLKKQGEKQDKTLHDGMHNIVESLTDDDNNINGLTQTLHDGLDTLSDKMDSKSNLEEAIHDGFDNLASKFSDKNNLESVIHDGLHDLTEQISSQSEVDQILHNGLDGIKGALEKSRNPIVNLPSSFGTSCKFNKLGYN